MKTSDVVKILSIALIALGTADLLLGDTNHPIPLVGDYLSQRTDLVLIGVGAVAWWYA